MKSESALLRKSAGKDVKVIMDVVVVVVVVVAVRVIGVPVMFSQGTCKRCPGPEEDVASAIFEASISPTLTPLHQKVVRRERKRVKPLLLLFYSTCLDPGYKHFITLLRQNQQV